MTVQEKNAFNHATLCCGLEGIAWMNMEKAISVAMVTSAIKMWLMTEKEAVICLKCSPATFAAADGACPTHDHPESHGRNCGVTKEDCIFFNDGKHRRRIVDFLKSIILET